MNITPCTVENLSSMQDIPVQPHSFLQTPFWARFKQKSGWTPHFFTCTGNKTLFISVLTKPIPWFGVLAYIPLGPGIAIADSITQCRYLEEICSQLEKFLPKQTICIRIDPPWLKPDESCSFSTMVIQKAVADIQPPDTVVLDLTKDLDTLSAEMKPKWRYNCKLGEKKGLSIQTCEKSDELASGIEIFYTLYLETAQRDGIAIHSKSYYQSLIDHSMEYTPSILDKSTHVRIYIAFHENLPLASIIVLFCGTEAVYLYGASSNEKRNLMPTYALQLRAITDAKSAGCETYDFYGIPPTDDPAHPMHGLYRFKTGFGGVILHRVGSYDYPVKTSLYKLWRFAEQLRNLWFKRIIKTVMKIHRKSST